MSTIFKRIFNMLRSYGVGSSGVFDRKDDNMDSYTDNYEDHFDSTDSFFDNSNSEAYPDYPDQILEDLSNFHLPPPSSLSEVKKARNQEIKKYHPDRYMDDPERVETAKEIMQIYNASYERLKKFFQSRSG
jgi:DnaJ-domain-containing protein 1